MKQGDSITAEFGEQESMFIENPRKHFDGPDYIPKIDQSRLENQHERIKQLMLDGVWRTYQEISIELGYPEASISAQLRHLRKDRFGGFTVNRRRRTLSGLSEYQVLE